MKMGIIGGGFVGNAQARVWMEHAEVRVYDVLPERKTHSLKEVCQCDFVFLCLPTPSHKDGTCDTSTLTKVLHDIKLMMRGVAVIKSTVPVGFTERASEIYPHIIHCPEFLTQRCAVTDAHTPSRHLVGYPREMGGRFSSVLLKRFPGVPLLEMKSWQTEAVKLAVNTFFAIKVAYFNELYEGLSKRPDFDRLLWDDIMRGILSDGRIAHSHTRVPGPDGKRGFGGACLPKDAQNLADCLAAAGGKPLLTEAALYRNKLIDRKE